MWISQATDGWSPDHIAEWLAVVERNLVCDFQLQHSSHTEALVPLFFFTLTEAGRQRKPSHMDKLQSHWGSQDPNHRKASAGSTANKQDCARLLSFFLPFCSLQHHISFVVTLKTSTLSISVTTKTQQEHTLHTLRSFWSVKLLERKPLNTHTLPAWFSASHTGWNTYPYKQMFSVFIIK